MIQEVIALTETFNILTADRKPNIPELLRKTLAKRENCLFAQEEKVVTRIRLSCIPERTISCGGQL